MKKTMEKKLVATLMVAAALSVAPSASFADDDGRFTYGKGHDTTADNQMTGINNAHVDPVLTIGEAVNGYTPPGIPDGMQAYSRGRTVQILSNHELESDAGYPYTLANGTALTGARVSSFILSKVSRNILDASLAYHTMYDRTGAEVTSPDQVNGGLNRLCSARGVAAGQYDFEDNIFFTGEEYRNGTEWALDVDSGELWAAPALGRAAWESVSPVDTGNPETVGLIIGDDTSAAPLYYYVGKKNDLGDNSFLDRNGLAQGQLYCWASKTGELNPEEFNGTGGMLAGEWMPLAVRDESMAGQAGYDEQGYLDGDTLRTAADNQGCFSFSRPEDVHNNPHKPTEVVFTSTGRQSTFPADNWGTLYIVDVASAELKILLDDDDQQFRDFGIRSADNLVWADNGKIYVQEDRSTGLKVPKDPAGCAVADDPEACRDDAFGGRSTIEASIWEINPHTEIKSTVDIQRIGVMNRAAALPSGQVDTDPLDLGDWESSGIIDVTRYFKTVPGSTLLFANTQAHSVSGGAIDSENLVQGGQYFFITIPKERAASIPFGNRTAKWNK